MPGYVRLGQVKSG